MIRRREFIGMIGAGAAMWPAGARAQQGRKLRRIGFLANDPTLPFSPAGQSFAEGLRENGFIEGQNIEIQRRFAQGSVERAAQYAAELVSLGVELMVASPTQGALAAKQATKTIPIVMLQVFDPVAQGLVANIASPGGNITGIANNVSADTAGKRLEQLKEAVPSVSRVAVFRHVDPGMTDEEQWGVLQRASGSLDIKLQAFPVRSGVELQDAFLQISRETFDALFLPSTSSLFFVFRRSIVDFAAAARLPGAYPQAEFVEEGGLMSYAASRPEAYRRAAAYVAKILNGAKPGDLPVELPTKFELAINLRTAKAFGLAIPEALLLRADEVIE